MFCHIQFVDIAIYVCIYYAMDLSKTKKTYLGLRGNPETIILSLLLQLAVSKNLLGLRTIIDIYIQFKRVSRQELNAYRHNSLKKNCTARNTLGQCASSLHRHGR